MNKLDLNKSVSRLLKPLLTCTLLIPMATWGQTGNWSDNAGTVPEPTENVIIIKEAGQLAALSKSVNNGTGYTDKTIRLANNIDLSNHFWTPIGNAEHPFECEYFDGNGYVIEGLCINSEIDKSSGFFGYVTNSQIINIGIVNQNSGIVSQAQYAGSLAGNIDGCTIVNCYNTANINHTSVTGGNQYLGGLIGYVKNSHIVNAYNSGEIVLNRNEKDQNLGGLIGYISDNATQVYCSFNYGQIKLTAGTGIANIGGLTGDGGQKTSPNYCYFLQNCINNSTTVDNIATLIRKSEFGTLTTDLNKGVEAYNATVSNEQVKACTWKNSGDYPTLEITSVKYAWDVENALSGTDYTINGHIITVETPLGLAWIAAITNKEIDSSYDGFKDQIIRLETPLDLKEFPWTAIGKTESTPFKGTFDGGGKEIEGLEKIDGNIGGLFGVIENGTIKNVSIGGNGYTGNLKYAGAIAGKVTGASLIINCSNTAPVTNTNANSSDHYTGAIAGYLGNGSKIINCYNTALIKSLQDVGGITGYAAGGSNIRSCYNSGTVYFAGTNLGYGIAGNVPETGDVSDCILLSGSGTTGGGGTIVTDINSDNTIASLNTSAQNYNLVKATEALASNPDLTVLSQIDNLAYGWDKGLLSPTFSDTYATNRDIENLFDKFTSDNRHFNLTSASQLEWIAKITNGGWTTTNNEGYTGKPAYLPVNAGYENCIITLEDDIEITNPDWTPIGNSESAPFKGTFEGIGRHINGLNCSGAEIAGLFGYNKGLIRNVTIGSETSSSQINGTSYAGAIAAVNDGTIINCRNLSCQVSGNNAGGLVGCNNKLLANSYNVAPVEGTNPGSIISCNHGTVRNCYALDNVLFASNNGTITNVIAMVPAQITAGKNTTAGNDWTVVNVNGSDIQPARYPLVRALNRGHETEDDLIWVSGNTYPYITTMTGTQDVYQLATQTENCTISILSPDRVKIPYDWKVEFTVDPASGNYELEEISVTDANGQPIPMKEENGKFTFYMPDNNVTVTARYKDIPEPEPIYYTVTLPRVEGVTTDPGSGEYTISENGNFIFSVILDKDYDQSEVVVKVNGEVLEPRQSDGKYVISQIDGNTEITIESVILNEPPVSNAQIDNGIRVAGSNRRLFIRTDKAETVNIYTLGGKHIKQIQTPGGEINETFPSGIYIVKVANQSFKINL